MRRAAAHPARRPGPPTARGATPQLTRAVDRFLGGDDRAFNDLYRALAPRVYGFLLRLARDPALAEDLTQETFTRIYQARGECRRDADIAPWACTIARNLFCDHVRRARLRRFEPGQADGYEHTLAPPAPQPDEALAARRMEGGVQEVLAGLPEGQVEAFRLVREEGRSLDEAAALLGRTELSVRLSVHRARTAIRAHLADRWGVSA
ncbi:MAG: RNA polymerase sigma factor [Minicystis sp.]